MKQNYSFDDVLLLPQYSDVVSRGDISLEAKLRGGINLSLPIISAPMDTVTGAIMASTMWRHGGLGIIHRYNSIAEQCQLVRKAQAGMNRRVGAAVGVSEDYLERAIALAKTGVGILCVDVAHGHHVMMRHALKILRNTLGTTIHIMAGNVATLKGFNDLADWGADSIRVGIGGGSICSTRTQTGHGQPTFSSILDCTQSDRDALLIADGGIRSAGDIVKALAAGADLVMVGSLLAGTEETPGKLYERKDGHSVKAYRGMASKEAQIEWRGRVSSDEGVSRFIPYKGSVRPILKSLDKNIRSGLSYSGASTILDLQVKAKFIRQTISAQVESSTHVDLVKGG
jgi:IMP dehydrogenase